MGLPLCHLTRLLRRFDLGPGTSVPAKCQAYLNYHCPVHRSILSNEQALSQR
jgi:hypothetical protein